MDKVGVWGKLVSRMQGEVPATTLEAYQRASDGVYDMLDHTETKREELFLQNCSPWDVPWATQVEILCAWNAYALQLLGDQFIEADYALNPATKGFLPPVTADQVLAFYVQVEGWLSRARQAHSNPGFQLDVSVPAALPPWSQVEPCPNAHLHGLLEAMRRLRDHAGITVAQWDALPLPAERQRVIGYAHQLWQEAKTKAEYAENLWGGNPSRDLHERIEEMVKTVIEQLYRLGQLLAMPSLLEAASTQPPPRKTAQTTQNFEVRIPNVGDINVDLGGILNMATQMRGAHAQGRASTQAFEQMFDQVFERTFTVSSSGMVATDYGIPAPGEPGFDPWCLTDPDMLATLKADPAARQAIAHLWKLDPDPQTTVRTLGEVHAAYSRGDIAYAKKEAGQRVGHFFCCPWSPVYITRRAITLGGTALPPAQTFVYDVNCEGYNLGRPFVRHILARDFAATDEREYGDPNEPPDH